MVSYDRQPSPSLLPRATEFSEVLKTSATPLGLESSVYSYSSHSVPCPTEDKHWHLRDDVLPTIAGLNLESLARTTSSTLSDSTATASASTAGSTASGASDNQGSKSGLSGAAKIGLGVGIAVGVVLILTLLWFFFRKRSQRKQERTEPKTISTLPAGEKAELQGGQFNESIAGPVFPRNELDPKSSTTVRRRPVSEHQQLNHHTNETNRAELQEHTSSNAPWLHDVSGFAPPELHSAALLEANTENAVPRSGSHRSDFADAEEPQASEVTPISRATPMGEPVGTADRNVTGDHDAALAREADALVQELGWISTQKRNVPEQDRRGQRYKEILEREKSVRGRLGEIDAMTRT
jgi:hypothetical protein